MSLTTLFNPKSIAVIGASTTPGAVGHIIVQNLIEEHFPGKIFPVNPKTHTLLGLPCYPTIGSIQEPIDVAIIVVPAPIVPAVILEVAVAGIKAVIIISAGFKEAGVNGKVLEQQIKDTVLTHNMTLLGPNCLGFLHPKRSLNASFAKGLPRVGNITFFSQSGALCTTLLDETRDSLGFAHVVSIGNKTTLKEAAILEYFITEPETGVIAFYTEDLEDSSTLIALGRQALLHNPPKPIIALKSGVTTAGSTASSSHTGAVAGSDHAYDTLFKQAYITRAENFEHLTSMLAVFSQNSLPDSNRLAIITNAGGMGVLATDAATKNGLVMAELLPTTVQDLQLSLPAVAGTQNPIDVLGDALAERYALAINLVAKDPNVDMIMVIVTPQAMTEAEATAEVLVTLKATTKKPLVAVFTKGESLRAGTAILGAAGVAVLYQPEAAARALASLAQVKEWERAVKESLSDQSRINPGEKPEPQPLTPDENDFLSEANSRALLEKYGFTFPKTVAVHSKKELSLKTKLFDTPVVLKIISPDIIHKSDVGGVLVGINPEDIAFQYDALINTVKKNAPTAKLEGVLIAEMAPATNLEIILGIKEEPGLGKLIVVGMGGIYVEILHDIASRFAPVTTSEAKAMLSELRSFLLLAGARGQQAVNLEVLTASIVSLSELALAHPEICELDINPLVPVEDTSFLALDARIRVTNK